MSLEEHTNEDLAERCEECGARLTPRELREALDNGGPVLCSIHLAEIVPVDDGEEDAGALET